MLAPFFSLAMAAPGRQAAFRRAAVGHLAFVAALAAGGIAYAGLGQPSPWQMNFQQSASPSMDDIVWFHNLLLWIIAAITAFVLVLLLICIVKFNAKANPTPSRTTHNTMIEVAWTVIPVIILVVIGVRNLTHSRVGRAWISIREDEDAAQLMGVPTFKFKLWAFASGAAIAGLAGALFAGKQNFVNSQRSEEHTSELQSR